MGFVIACFSCDECLTCCFGCGWLLLCGCYGRVYGWLFVICWLLALPCCVSFVVCVTCSGAMILSFGCF